LNLSSNNTISKPQQTSIINILRFEEDWDAAPRSKELDDEILNEPQPGHFPAGNCFED